MELARHPLRRLRRIVRSVQLRITPERVCTDKLHIEYFGGKALIVDVHSHNPTHEHDVPSEDVTTNPLIGTGVKLAGSLSEYVRRPWNRSIRRSCSE